MKKAQLVERLEKAIKTLGPKGPGKWTVDDHGGCVLLFYSLEVDQEECWPCPHLELKKDQDSIWNKWGGNEVLNYAGVSIKTSGSDSYTDKYGDKIYCEYVTIEYEEDEE